MQIKYQTLTWFTLRSTENDFKWQVWASSLNLFRQTLPYHAYHLKFYQQFMDLRHIIMIIMSLSFEHLNTIIQYRMETNEHESCQSCYWISLAMLAASRTLIPFIMIANLHYCYRSFEQAAMICKENKEIDQCLHLMQTAAVMFQEHGTPDTAALTLDKAAK